MLTHKRNRAGFTLIELLAVISIVGLLASIVLASLSTVRKNARFAAAKQFAHSLDTQVGISAVGWWNLSECAGTSIGDQSGLNNNGTIQGAGYVWSSTNTPTSQGCFLAFAGTQYISVPNSSSINFGTSQDFTLGAWVQLSASQSDYAGIIAHGGGGGGSCSVGWCGYQLVLVGNKIAAEVSTVSGFLGVGSGLQGTAALNDGNWHYLALVVKRATNTAALFVDGAAQASVASAVVSGLLDNTNALYIGSERLTSVRLNGSVDNPRVFASALTALQLQKLYAEGAGTHAFTLQ